MKRFIVAMLLLFSLAGCLQGNNTGLEAITVTATAYSPEDELAFEKEISAFAGETAFDVLVQNDFPFTYEESAYGAFVTSIAGYEPLENDYIAIYVNDEYSQRGISDIALENGMELEFRFEELSAFPAGTEELPS